MMGLLTSSRELKQQFYFRGDSRAEFRRLELDGPALVVKKDGKITEAYKHYFELEFQCNGYGKVHAGPTILGFPRDILLEPGPFKGMIAKDKKPPDQAGLECAKPLESAYIRQIGADKRYKLQQQKPIAAIWDRVTVALLCVDVIVAVGFLIVLLKRP